MNFYQQFKLKLMTSFNGFKMFQKRGTYTAAEHDVTITSAYISFNETAMKQLNSEIGKRIAVAAIKEDDHEKILIAGSHGSNGYEVVQKDKVKKSHAIIYMSLGKKKPETKGNYFLKRYGSHENHEWWEVVTEKPKKIRMF